MKIRSKLLVYTCMAGMMAMTAAPAMAAKAAPCGGQCNWVAGGKTDVQACLSGGTNGGAGACAKAGKGQCSALATGTNNVPPTSGGPVQNIPIGAYSFCPGWQNNGGNNVILKGIPWDASAVGGANFTVSCTGTVNANFTINVTGCTTP